MTTFTDAPVGPGSDEQVAVLFAEAATKLQEAQEDSAISEEDFEVINNQAYYASLRYDSTPEGLSKLRQLITTVTENADTDDFAVERTTDKRNVTLPLDSGRPLNARMEQAELFRSWQLTVVKSITEVEASHGAEAARSELASLYMTYLEGSSQLEENIGQLEEELSEDAQEVAEAAIFSGGVAHFSYADLTFINEQYMSLYRKNYELSYLILRVADLQDCMDALTAKIGSERLEF